jgi:hypothetical protein
MHKTHANKGYSYIQPFVSVWSHTDVVRMANGTHGKVGGL